MGFSRTLETQVLTKLIEASFENPSRVASILEHDVSKNRTLNSSRRRELSHVCHDALRWRRRLWPDDAYGDISFEDIQDKLSVIQSWTSASPTLPEKISLDDLAQLVSFPTWLIGLWARQYELSEVLALALSMNQEAPVCLRANLLKNTREELQAMLLREGIETQVGQFSQTALYVKDRKNIRGTLAFKKGRFDLQDEASQKAVEFSGARPGQTVLDACARTGGKSIALAAQMQNKGKVVACDIDARTLDELKIRAARAGATCIHSQWVAPADGQPLSFLKTEFETVFVDAPCSGLGVLRRKSFAKWLLKPEELSRFPELQLSILEKYAHYVKAKGNLLFSTCTLHEAENQSIVRAFLKAKSSAFSLVEMREFRPDLHTTDGFFMALLQKN